MFSGFPRYQHFLYFSHRLGVYQGLCAGSENLQVPYCQVLSVLILILYFSFSPRGRMSRERSWTRLDDNLDFFKIFQNLFPFFTFVFLTLLTGALLMDDGSALSWPQSSKTW